jgi:uncharacterized membrane protein
VKENLNYLNLLSYIAMFEKTDSSTRQIVIAAIMASLVCVTTLLIQIPIPATQGFFNVGDAMIMLAAFIGGPIVGAIAGGLGASLADFIGGWYIWVIPTLIIKGVEGFLAGWIGRNGFSRKVLGWLIGGGEMVTGYLLVQILFYGLSAALFEVPYNIVQMSVGGLVGIPLAEALKRRLQ